MLNLQYDGLERSIIRTLIFGPHYIGEEDSNPGRVRWKCKRHDVPPEVFIVNMLSLAGEHHADGHAGLPERVQRHGHQLQREVAELFILWRYLAGNSLREGHSKRETNTSYGLRLS